MPNWNEIRVPCMSVFCSLEFFICILVAGCVVLQGYIKGVACVRGVQHSQSTHTSTRN